MYDSKNTANLYIRSKPKAGKHIWSVTIDPNEKLYPVF